MSMPRTPAKRRPATRTTASRPRPTPAPVPIAPGGAGRSGVSAAPGGVGGAGGAGGPGGAGGGPRRAEVPLIPLHTAAQVRAAEAPLVEAGHGETLMRRAAHALAQEVLDRLETGCGRVYGAVVVGLIGSGSNGGDGLHALAKLRRRGVDARAVLLREDVHPDGLAAFRAVGGRTVEVIPASTEVLLDAIIGTGSRSGFTLPDVEGLAELLECRRESIVDERRPQVVACDVPSGVDVDTGTVAGDVIEADCTVTFGGCKTGLVIGAGSQAAGVVRTVPIGIEANLELPVRWLVGEDQSVGSEAGQRRRRGQCAPGGDERPAPLVRPRPADGDHKYSRGAVHVIAGSREFPGAAQLTSAAAVSTGVGMVVLQAPEEVRDRLVTMMPEVVTTSGRGSSVLQRATAAAVGPGIGRDVFQLAALGRALEWAGPGRPCVIDASALSHLNDSSFTDVELGPHVLLTPHLGEIRGVMADLDRDDLIELLESDPAAAVEQLAEQLEVTVLLKGPSTVIAAPDAPTVVHRVDAPGLATAGSGDVLTGIIGALAAVRPEEPMWRTAALGVRIHAQAAGRIDPFGCGAFGAGRLIEAVSPTSGTVAVGVDHRA